MTEMMIDPVTTAPTLPTDFDARWSPRIAKFTGDKLKLVAAPGMLDAAPVAWVKANALVFVIEDLTTDDDFVPVKTLGKTGWLYKGAGVKFEPVGLPVTPPKPDSPLIDEDPVYQTTNKPPKPVPFVADTELIAVEVLPGDWRVPGTDATYNIKGVFGRSGGTWLKDEKQWRFRGGLPDGVRTRMQRVIGYDDAIVETPKPAAIPIEEPTPTPVVAPEPLDDKLPSWFVKPSWWNDLVTFVKHRPAIAIVGPGGNGKTSAAEIVLQALDIDYAIMSCTDRTEVVDLVGGAVLTKDGEEWRDGLVTRAFKDGKAVILDEADALDPRVMMCLQTATLDPGPDAKSRFVTADGAKIYPVKALPLIATFNTWGSGANRQYVGRNKLDAASLDRWTFLATGYENEEQMLIKRGVKHSTARSLVEWAKKTRGKIDGAALPLLLSPRTLFRMAQALDQFGWTFAKTVDMEFLGRVDPAMRDLVA